MKKNWSSIRIGKVLVKQGTPAIITSYRASTSESLLKDLRTKGRMSDIIEIRYDLFLERSEKDLQSLLSGLSLLQLSYIFTYRTDSVEEALTYYGIAADSGAPAIDVDIRLPDVSSGKSLRFSSYHGEHTSVSRDLLRQLLSAGPDVVKLGISYENREDLLSDINIIEEEYNGIDRPLCFSPMGNDSFMRAVAAYFVSDFVYAAGSGKTAPGQLTAGQYRSIFRLY